MNMEGYLHRQTELIASINQANTNFKKDSKERKTPEYIQKKLVALDAFWTEFQANNQILVASLEPSHDYFAGKHFENTRTLYLEIREIISSYSNGEEKGSPSKLDELRSKQRTNFRAFSRVINGIDIGELTERWEISDKLQLLQERWKAVDECHWEIDNLIEGADFLYESEFNRYERKYEDMKRELNRKINSALHLQQSTPKVDIPVFSGKYDQWPTFYDLFSETIHNSPCLSKSQKMQHLKSKLKGEAERLIKHLNTSSDNYDTAWELLLHRYNNPQLIFSQYVETFLNQPKVQKRTCYELKRLYDTTMESINAIQNLGIDTTTWDPMLVHLLIKKLDDETCTDYKESRKSPRELPTLGEFLQFLENKYTALEPMHKKEREENSGKQFSQYSAFNNKGKYQKYKATATYTCKCPFCKQEHDLIKCKRFLNMTSEAKMKTIAKLHICKNCLYIHTDENRTCNSNRRCRVCSLDHNTVIHDAATQHGSNSGTEPKNAVKAPAHGALNVNYVAGGNEEILLTTLTLKVKAADGTYTVLRALLDQGSQISLISEHAAQLLGLKRQRYQASVSGIGYGSKQSKGMVTLDCQSIYHDHDFSTQALVISRVINDLPNSSFGKQSWPHLRNIQLADPEYNVSRPIDILLDASVYSDIIMSGLVKGPSQAPIAQQTRMGWILSGHVKTFQCNVVINNLDDLTKYWELEGISEATSILTSEEQYCEDLYQATTTRRDNGRYEVALPMKPDFEKQLGSSRPRAVAQFIQMEKKMAKNDTLAEKYRKFMLEYEDLGHMHRVETSNDKACYLPHHGVLKADSTTTSLRVVFNASQRTSSGHSLNDLMERGPNLQQDLQALILKWRQHKYVLTADIEKMFRQILVRPSDQHLQSIIWRDATKDMLQEYHLSTVTYGTKAAPYLAIRTLKQIARDNVDSYPLAATALENSFYMDDLMSGNNSFEQAKELQRQLIEVLRQAGMNIRKWSSNDPELIKDLSPEQLNSTFEFRDSESRKTLGLQWNSASDTFSFKNKEYNDNSDYMTKRQLLSDISKLYDPLGWLSPITIKAKLLFQRTWVTDISWDDQLPTDIAREWLELREDLKDISQLSIARHLGDTKKPFQLHGFCDASEKAYACVIYIVTQDDEGNHLSKLVMAKTKVAPQNRTVSLPRLELLGALLLAELVQKVAEALGTQDIKTYAWTDSMVVLGWLQGDPSRWKQFVANRVRKINEIIPSSNWRHVRSEENPADCATRGLTISNLLNFQLWWTGPDWVQGYNPDDIDIPNYKNPDIEVKKTKIHSVNTALVQCSFIKDLLNNSSSITRVIKVIAWVSRYLARSRKQQNAAHGTVLTTNELQAAHNLASKEVQTEHFAADLVHMKKVGHVKDNSRLASLHPFMDDQGILRVGGRLANSLYSDKQKHPVILPQNSRYTDLLISQAHITTLHGGPKLTLSYLRETFWIVSGIRAVKKQLRECVKCRRHSQTTNRQIMADLPSPRVTPSRPFTNTGVDFTGHVEVKSNKGRGIKTSKGYIAVFVCLATKAIHLELVSDMSTAGFLAAFRRFCSRRGTPKAMYSDNGTNFIGAARLLKREYQEIMNLIDKDEVIVDLSSVGVTWHFNAPAWPTAGGLWEAAVKSLKHHLKRVLGEQRLTYEEFTTLLHQIEASLNSRPLCSLTENVDDYVLTPGHFLVGGSLLSRPQTDPDSITLSRKWQLVQNMNKQFWKLWSREYLQQLQTRSKWRKEQRDLTINDIVVVKEDNMPPGKWALGRVQELHTGKDGHVRVVTLKTETGSFKRPINKLILLPVNDQQDKPAPSPSNPDQGNPPPQRRQRKARSNLFLAGLMLFLTLFTPSASSETPSYNITTLNANQGLYFDKISDLQHIKDEWKLVAYQNMSTYWQGLSDVKDYVTHLDELIGSVGIQGTQYHSVVLQLKHEINEIEHYNKFLINQPSLRQKRGLINGVGYIANSLFGVLDQQFADQYKADIERIAVNENHLQGLIKNQTLIIETELNVLQRNEQIMNNQFAFIRRVIGNLTAQEDTFMMETRNGMYLISSSLAANIILSSLRRIQQTLIDTITDIRQGRFDTHLLSPEQLEEQVNLISARLKGDLTLPVQKENLRDLYKLLKVHARIVDQYLIMEIRIPILSSEVYELDRLIAIPPTRTDENYYVIPVFPYIAVNLRKDLATFLTDNDLRQCLQVSPDKILCAIDLPMYDFKMGQSICDIKLVNIDTKSDSPCTFKRHATCAGAGGDKWVRLHTPNRWLYSCCEECSVRILCTAGIDIKKIAGNGLLFLGQGCTLRGEKYALQSHNDFASHINGQFDIYVPEISVLNKIKTSAPLNLTFDGPEETHEKVLNKLKPQIDQLKQESSQQLSIHDIHHYSLLYALVVIIILMGIIYTMVWLRRRRALRDAEALDAAAAPVPLTVSAAATQDAVAGLSHATRRLPATPVRSGVVHQSEQVKVNTGVSPQVFSCFINDNTLIPDH